MKRAENAIAGPVAGDLWANYGIDAAGAVPVEGGWLNKKWKLKSPKGPVLVKQYSVERFGPQQLSEIEQALRRQLLLEASGIPCPHIWKAGDCVLRRLDSATCYVVMDFVPGRQESCKTVTAGQLYGLGVVCGRMQQAFAAMPVQGARGYPPPRGQRMMERLWAFCESYQAAADAPAALARAMAARKSILKSLEPGFFDRLPMGLSHEDFTPDNMLFDGQSVAAILDFDRNQYGYLYHDVGRALLSFALVDGMLATEKARAFLEGYAQVKEAPVLADALRLTWCIEFPWWIQPRLFGTASPKVARFQKEICWITDHWFELDKLLMG